MNGPKVIYTYNFYLYSNCACFKMLFVFFLAKNKFMKPFDAISYFSVINITILVQRRGNFSFGQGGGAGVGRKYISFVLPQNCHSFASSRNVQWKKDLASSLVIESQRGLGVN